MSSVEGRPISKGGRSGSPLPRWIPPQLCQLVETAPSGPQRLHEIKLDDFRMAARIDDETGARVRRYEAGPPGRRPAQDGGTFGTDMNLRAAAHMEVF